MALGMHMVSLKRTVAHPGCPVTVYHLSISSLPLLVSHLAIKLHLIDK